MSLDRGWEFRLSSRGKNQGSEIEEVVDVPHDFSIVQERDAGSPGGASNGFFRGGVGTYERTITVPADWSGRQVVLELEGVYMNATVRGNRQLVTYLPYGYTTFWSDLTPYIRFGQENRVSITVNNGAMPNTRWYSGSGLYRHVWLHVVPKTHIAPWGVSVTTPKTDPGSSVVMIETTIERSDTVPSAARVRQTLRDTDGTSVATDEIGLTIEGDSRLVVDQRKASGSTVYR